jgi:hypothetical protein
VKVPPEIQKRKPITGLTSSRNVIYAGTQILAELDDLIGCLAPCKNRRLILALSGVEERFGFAELNPDAVQLTTLASFDSKLPAYRFNDGSGYKCSGNTHV